MKSYENLTKWKDGFIEHAGPTDSATFPFVVLGNKIDKEQDRKVPTTKGQQWCKENGDIPYYETSAKENVSVDDAFIHMATMAIKRQGSSQMIMPDIGGVGGM